MLFLIGLVVGGTLGMFITALCTISAIEEVRHECMEMMRGDPDGSQRQLQESDSQAHTQRDYWDHRPWYK